MKVVKNMLTSDPNKGPYMKPFFVLLLPFVLALCGSTPVPAQDGLPTAQADAVAAIEKLGGRVRLDTESGAVVSVFLGDTQITGAGLEHLNGMTFLNRLILDGTQITDAGLEHLKGIASLVTLDLSATQITGAGLEHLKGLTSLSSLGLNDTQITDAGLEHLKGLTSLRHLKLDNTQVTDAGLAELKAALPNCEVSK